MKKRPSSVTSSIRDEMIPHLAGIFYFIPNVLDAAKLSAALSESPVLVWPLFSSLESLSDLNLDDLIEFIKGASSSSSSSCFSSSS